MPKVSAKIKQNYFINLSSLLAFMLVLLSGIIMLRYHGGTNSAITTWGIKGKTWLLLHQVSGTLTVPLIITHLWMHRNWLKNLFRNSAAKAQNHDLNVGLLITYFLCAFTAAVAWLILGDTKGAGLLLEIHNKLGLFLLFFVVAHLYFNFRWLRKVSQKLKAGKK